VGGRYCVRFGIAITETHWEQLLNWLKTRNETAGVLTARIGTGTESTTFLVRSLTEVPHQSYVDRRPDFLSIRSTGYVPALRMAANDSAVGIFVHSHPSGDARHSELDDVVDAQIAGVFQYRTRQSYFLSMVLAGSVEAPTFTARVYLDRQLVGFVESVRIVGSRIRVVSSAIADQVPDLLFDRQVRAFGAQGQALLRRMRIGVVGAGGTGSAVAEQLVRLGVGEIVLVDDDRVEDTNVTRIHEATIRDVGQYKVEVLAARAKEIGTGTHVTAIRARLNEPSILRPLADCDVVFGCTDDVTGRSILARFAYWYLVPVFDMGFIIDSREGHIRGLFGRITTLVPGAPCLVCRGRISPESIYYEALAPRERRDRIAEGYAPELAEPAPAVIPYTTVVASLAVSEFLSRLFSLSESPPNELLLRVLDRVLSRPTTDGRPGHFCIAPHYWGLGDQTPPLGQMWTSE